MYGECGIYDYSKKTNVKGDNKVKYSKDIIMPHLYDCESGKYNKIISGWWKDSVFEIYDAIDSLQDELNISGNLCEIGTWHGRSFLPLRNFTKDHETCIGIDIFKNDYHAILIKNINNCFGSLAGSKIIKVKTTSSVSDKCNVLKPFQPIRIFYIDGDHTYNGALLDLNVAKATLHQDGIMFLDDYENPTHGPAVTKAVNNFLSNNPEFTLAFSSTQRIFLCRTHMVESYISAMSTLKWDVGKDVVWLNLINFEHPVGYNSWQIEKINENET